MLLNDVWYDAMKRVFFYSSSRSCCCWWWWKARKFHPTSGLRWVTGYYCVHPSRKNEEEEENRTGGVETRGRI